MFSWHSLVLVVVMGLTMLGVDIHLQVQKSGGSFRELGLAGYRETIRARIEARGGTQVASKAREAREAQRLPKGGQPYMDAIAEMTSHAAPGRRADAPLPVLDPPERARATGGRPPEAMPEPTPETVADRMAGGSGIGEARGGALGAMLKRFADDGLSGMMDELRGGAVARFDGAQVPAASQSTVTQGGIAESGAVKRFKAGVAVCTTNGGIKRCRIGG